ncbi:MAG TPA: sigma 54-interacting transcriptional regulator [Candidatus Polarisedimenticolia bacterium]|nr:sigma 54-interacting transcriptional regulator [Candidatus Polarisedimenticolia bacterium]
MDGPGGAPPVPDNEEERAESVRRTGLLDTPPEPEFDDLARLAAELCGAPMAAVTLVDTGRQWLKARLGLDVTQTPRDVAFCARAILGDGLFVVRDAAADPRFSSNPLVTGPPGIRFYAGAPLITSERHALGTVCVLDRVPRDLTAAQGEALLALGRQAMGQIHLRMTRRSVERTLAERQAAEEALRASEELKSRMIESSRDCIKLLDREGRLLSMNEGGLKALEICDLQPLLQSVWMDFWKGGAHYEQARQAVAAALRGEVGRFLGFLPTMMGKPRWWDVVVSPILGPAGEVERLLSVSRDVTDHVRAQQMLKAIGEGTASVTGSDFFRSLVRHLASALGVKFAFVAECEHDSATTLAFWAGDGYADNVEYDLAGTPCLEVHRGDTCFFPRGLGSLFPADKPLIELGAESYLGVPLMDAARRVIGHLVILHDRPLEEDPQAVSVLESFAARAGAELERLKAEEKLRAALEEVRVLKNRLHAENVYLQEEIRREHNFDEMVGTSPALLSVLRQVEQVAPTDATVLILGETGTGKELLSRALHDHSPRNQRPLVKVNCGAISAGLVESELFGHVKGAFTGALDRRVGRFELADGGTLFLDEVGELPPDTQVKLLRVLQEQEFEPVGSSRTQRVDVRVIAATNRDLEEAMKAGRFRSDLFYRLMVFPLRLPPLRERRSDIPQLAAFFLGQLARRAGKQVESISRASMDRLMAYDWPGNVRELKNVLERALVLCRGPVLELDEGLLPPGWAAEARPAPAEPAPAEPAFPLGAAPLPTLEDAERGFIMEALRRAAWIIEGPRGAAQALSLHPNTLRSRMKKLGIVRPRSHDIS